MDLKQLKKNLKWQGRATVSQQEYKKAMESLVDEGYVIKAENEFQAILQAPKRFNWTAFILLSLVFNIFGLFGYLIYYGTKTGGKQVTLNKISSATKKSANKTKENKEK